MRKLQNKKPIQQYLLNDMSQEERIAFEKQLAANPELKEEVQMFEQLNRLIYKKGLLETKNKLTKIHYKNTAPNAFVKKSFFKRPGFYIPSAALFIIVVIFVINHFSKDASNSSKIMQAEKNNAISQKIISEQTENTPTPTLLQEEQEQNTSQGQQTIMEESGDKSILIPLTQAETQAEIIEDTSGIIAAEKNANVISETVPKEKPDDDPIRTEKNVIDCGAIKLYATINTEAACKNEPTGSLTIKNTRGGTPPYRYSINEGRNFYADNTFGNLVGGTYHIIIKDANNCITIKENVLISEKNCFDQYSEKFAPDYGEKWEIPIEPGLTGTIKIYNKYGSMVFVSVVRNGDQWDGKDRDGKDLPMGEYLFFIEYKDGYSFNGTVTIVK